MVGDRVQGGVTRLMVVDKSSRFVCIPIPSSAIVGKNERNGGGGPSSAIVGKNERNGGGGLP
jgi:hypothetical protein